VDIRLTVRDRWLTLAQQAVEQKRAIELDYYSANRDETTHRVIDPVRVFVADGIGYLEAWCRRAVAMRIFRLDRFENATVLDEPANPPADVTLADVSAGVYRPAPEHLLVELRLGPGWEWVSDYYPCETVVPAGAGQRVTLRVANPAWVAALVRRSGGAVRVLAPDWLARDVEASAAQALAAYRGQ
jgi:proteasome accessory factor C